MKKIVCILDACSYIYLNQFSVRVGNNDKTIFDFLQENMIVKISQEVGKEITKHHETTSTTALNRNNLVHSYQKLKLEQYEDILLKKALSDYEQDRGEIENFITGLDLFLDKKELMVFLTDDKKAVKENTLLDELFKTFPYFKLWTSFEVVLFIYTHKALDYENTKNAIKDLNVFVFQPQRLEFEKQKQELEENKANLSNNEYSIKMKEIKDRIVKLNEEATKQFSSFQKRVEKIKQITTKK
jgi:uncharacterized protein YutE (UPF0331/DUF86 family)